MLLVVIGVALLDLLILSVVFTFGVYTSCEATVRTNRSSTPTTDSHPLKPDGVRYSWDLNADEVDEIDNWDEFEENIKE